MGDFHPHRLDDPSPDVLTRPTLAEQGAAIVKDQATDSVTFGAALDNDRQEASAAVKAGGDRWSVYAWARWAKEKVTGRSGTSAGVGGEVRW